MDIRDYINENITNQIASQIRLDARRRRILEHLQSHDMMVAKIYEGAINVLQNTNIPNRVNYCAHGIREIIDKLPEHIDAPIIKSPISRKFNHYILEDPGNF